MSQIKSVDDFIAAIDDEDEGYIGTSDSPYEDDPVSWDTAGSVEGGDAAGRLGIEMGEPSHKTAAFLAHFTAASNSHPLVKEAIAAAVARRGIMAAGKGALEIGKRVIGRGARASKAIPKGANPANIAAKKPARFGLLDAPEIGMIADSANSFRKI